MSVIEKLDYDSGLIGAPVGRVIREELSGRAAAKLDSEFRDGDYECVYLELPLEDVVSINRALDTGFSYVSTRTFLKREVTKADLRAPRAPDGLSLVSGKLWDFDELIPLADELVTVTRFWADRKFPRAKAKKLYRDWFRKSLSGEMAFESLVLKDRNKCPVGIVTLSDKEGAGDLTLVGLRKNYTGRGLGRVLILRALAELARREIWRATVSTQGENIAALHAYCDAGFLPTGSRVVLHRWKE